MTRTEVNYNALATEPRNPFCVQQMPPDEGETEDDAVTDTDNEDQPRDSGLMIHVVPDTSKARWSHIVDLDTFFTRIYNYHQKHGFAVMMLQEFFELVQFVFVVTFVVFLCYGVNYPVLFGEEKKDFSKIKIPDTLYSPEQTVAAISGWSWLLLAVAILFWVFRAIKVAYHAVQYWDVKKFYNTVLKIEDDDLDNYTWHEVQRRIRDVQSEQQMCIHKQHLTELDIYHRILRFKNYMVAMMNKNLIPAKICVPLLGECVVLSRGLRYNIELILFRGPWSPFENNWHIKEEFKRANRRTELAQKLSRQIAWLALAHFVLSPLIFLWALMVFFFNYADLIKREPGTLGARCWSQYGMLYMRHFNELDHELNARLNRAYRPACKYMNTFSSPLMAVISGNIVFICGGVLSVLIILSIYDEDVLQVQHVLTIMSVLTAAVVMCRVFIPDENLIICPEQLMTAVLAHTHYLPITWRGLAHTTRVREQFGQFFQFRCTYLLNELLSPLITPYVLMFYFRPRSLDLVDFFRNFTVAVVGVGDVCSFAQMDVRRHGNPDWQPAVVAEPQQPAAATAAIPARLPTVTDEEQPPPGAATTTTQYTQGEHGKTELSLMHFTLTNPGWRMPAEARQFVHGIRRHAQHDLDAAQQQQRGGGGATDGAGQPASTAMEQSLYMVRSMGGEYSSIVQSAINTQQRQFGGALQTSSQCSYGLRNPFAGVPVDGQQQQQQQREPEVQRPTASYDFQHMLNQNMSMDADMLRSGDSQQQQQPSSAYSSYHQQQQQPSLNRSLIGRQSRREGPADGSQEGLLHSVFRQSDAELASHPGAGATATDMCLSTLYLHELHHRQLRRRRAVGPPLATVAAAGRPLHHSHHAAAATAAGESMASRTTSTQSFLVSPGGSSQGAGGGGGAQLQMSALIPTGAAAAAAAPPPAVENTPLLSAAKKS